MMIMRFHKLIQSKLLWLIFLGILITTFVGWGVATTSSQDQSMARLDRSMGKVAGKDIPFIQLDITQRMLDSQAQSRMSAEELQEQAFTHLALVAYAESLGLKIPESFARQQFVQFFADETGEVDRQQLEAFRQSLRGGHITEGDYIRFFQEEMLIRNLQRTLASSILIPSFDVDRWAETQTEILELEFSPVGPDALEERVEVSEEEIEAYFEANKERFRLPEERAVRFFAVSAEAFLDEVPEVSDDAAREYYNRNLDDFTHEVEEESGEDDEPRLVERVMPYTDVADEIKKRLRLQAARKQAEDTAIGLAVRLIPRRGRPGRPMEEVAEEASLEVHTAGPVARWDQAEGLAGNPEFMDALFRLEMEEVANLGGPVEIDDHFVVLELTEIIPPRLPELSEVMDQARGSARADAIRRATARRAEELADSLRQSLEDGEPFMDAAEAAGLNVIRPGEFSMRDFNPMNPMLPPELIEAVSSKRPGELVGPLETQFGGHVIGMLVSRRADSEAAEELRPQIKQMLRAQLHFPELFASFIESRIEPLIERRERDADREDREI